MGKITTLWEDTLVSRLNEASPLIQILIGPRQVGKTTALANISKFFGDSETLYVSADNRQLEGAFWIETQWEKVRRSGKSILIFDEIQKIENWSEVVKKLWDQDRFKGNNIKVVLSGSSSLQIQQGLTESLAGRFELIKAIHWDFAMFHKLCAGSLEEYIYFGGYPGAAQFIGDEPRWRDYIQNSIIESVISKDIMLQVQVNKPALLRRLFQLGCDYSGQVLSYQKALGQLNDAGNTTTLSHYLNLLSQAFMLSGLEKIESTKTRLRASSPKYMVHNTALMSAVGSYTFAEVRDRPEIWGRYVESVVGAHLLNRARMEGFEVFYWRDRNKEIDFVVKSKEIYGIEVKTSHRSAKGMKPFRDKFPSAKVILLEHESGDIEEFLRSGVLDFLM